MGSGLGMRLSSSDCIKYPLTDIVAIHSREGSILVISPPVHVHPATMVAHRVAIATAGNAGSCIGLNIEELLGVRGSHLGPRSAICGVCVCVCVCVWGGGGGGGGCVCVCVCVWGGGGGGGLPLYSFSSTLCKFNLLSRGTHSVNFILDRGS